MSYYTENEFQIDDEALALRKCFSVRLMRRPLWTALLCLSLTGLGCHKDPEASTSASASETEPTPAAAPPLDRPDNAPEPVSTEPVSTDQPDHRYQPTLPSALLEPASQGYELLNAGEGTLEQLRFEPTPGQVEKIRLTMTMHMQISGPGVAPIVQNLPPLQQVNRAQTIAFSDDRIEEKIVFESFVVDGAGANAQLAAMMQATTEQIRGFEQTLVYDSRGDVIEGELSMPADTNPQLAQTLGTMSQIFEQTMVRFPEPAVGVGAQWRETSELDNNGIELEQTSQFELVAREGDLITFETQLTQRPLTDKFTPPNKPGAEVSLLEFDSRGGGRVVYELAKLMPSSAQTQIATQFTIETAIGGRTQQLTTKIDIELQLERLASQ